MSKIVVKAGLKYWQEVTLVLNQQCSVNQARLRYKLISYVLVFKVFSKILYMSFYFYFLFLIEEKWERYFILSRLINFYILKKT